MAVDYARTALEIIEAVGGAGNVDGAAAEKGAVRLTIRRPENVDEEDLAALPEVSEIKWDGDVLSIGVGVDAPSLLCEMRTDANWAKDAPAVAPVDGNLVKRLFQFLGECMMPILPAMLGAGMLKVVITICTTFGWLNTASSTYTILYSFGDAFFHFLPIFLALSIARRSGGSAMLYMVVGAALCYPDLARLMGGEPTPLGTFLGMPCTYLFGLPVICSTYTSSVLPMLLMVPVMKWAEGFADRVSPTVLKSFMKPLLFILICVPCVLYVLGPIGNVAGTWVADAFVSMYNAVPWLTMGLMAAVAPFLVMSGMHWALFPVMLDNLTTIGYDVIILVTMYCSNIAQGGAAFGAAVRTKRADIRADGVAAGISACVGGVTEPAMYGVNIPYVTPMGAAIAGATVSGLLCGITGVKGYAMGGSPSFLTAVTFIGGEDPVGSLMWGLVAGAAGLAISFILSYMLFRDPHTAVERAIEELGTGESLEFPKPSGSIGETLAAPVSGRVVPLSSLEDAAFFSGALGKGVAIQPTGSTLVSPCDGTVTAVAGTGHAVALTSRLGAQVLIHFGIDTVKLHGNGLAPKVKVGDKVLEGQVLLAFDPEVVRREGANMTTPVVVSNASEFAEVAPCVEGYVKQGEDLLWIRE